LFKKYSIFNRLGVDEYHGTPSNQLLSTRLKRMGTSRRKDVPARVNDAKPLTHGANGKLRFPIAYPETPRTGVSV
jgi:hypothetical protein